MSKNIAVVATGAIGSCIGADLTEAGYDVEGLIEEISGIRNAELPRSLAADDHWLMFTRVGSGVHTTRVPSRVADLLRG